MSEGITRNVEITLKRKDGAHSGNPAVRAAVLERKEAQHVAWVATRSGGGRGGPGSSASIASATGAGLVIQKALS